MSKDSFIDEDFPPHEYSLMGKSKDGVFLDPVESRHKIIKDSEIEWKRISDIVAKPVIYEDIINMDSIKYGRISLNYFYSVLSELANKYPSIFTKIILTKDYNPNGKYEVKLYIDGEFKIITIDDYFPCIKGTNVYYFTRPSNFEIWPLLIEKAWAKVNGGYLNILNLWAGDIFKALTGFSFDELIHPQLNKEELFNEICNKIKEKYSNTIIDNTICNATHDRQQEVVNISKEVDLMIIVGGKNSSNTKELANIASNYTKVLLIQEVNDLLNEKINYNKIGIMGGASTPKESIDEVYDYLKNS